jgi:hypothetical protein
MKLPSLILSIVTALIFSSSAQQDDLPTVKTSEGFKQLQQVVGKWKGKLTREDGTVVKIESEFRVTSNGSAIVERSVEDGTEMFTMYHDKNGQLTVTHYCALGNAPSFTLSKKDKNTLSFAFDSSCGLKAGKDKFVILGKLATTKSNQISFGPIIRQSRRTKALSPLLQN